MDFRKNLWVAVLILGVCAIPSAHADQKADRFSKKHERMEKKIEEIYSQLNLTPEQKKEIENNKLANREKRKALFEKMRAQKEALNQELMKTDLDMAKITEIQNNIKALQSQIVDERLESVLAVRKILSAQQFAGFIAQMEKSRQERRGKEDKE